VTLHARVLVVQPDAAFCAAIVDHLRDHYDVISAAGGAEARSAFAEHLIDLVVLECDLPNSSSVELIGAFRKHEIGVVAVTSNPQATVALEVLEAGADALLRMPFELAELDIVVKRSLEHRLLRREVSRLKHIDPSRDSSQMLLGISPAIEQVREKIRMVSQSPNTTVLIRGESGTGKELVAEALHAASERHDGPLIRVGCSSMPADRIDSELFGMHGEDGAFRPGLAHRAHQGTLLLDEIGDLPLDLQPKLLRLLEGHAVRSVGGGEEFEADVRFVAATSQDLEAMADAGHLRSDLLFRIKVFEISLPPLRDRVEDIPLLTQLFLHQFRARLGKPALTISNRAQVALSIQSWPGNIRELRNVVERAVIVAEGGVIDIGDLPRDGAALPPGARDNTPPLTLAEAERNHILHVYMQNERNKSRTAKLLGISRSTLREKLRLYETD
jgi:DNA-binding NtrC family response regulator